MTEDEAVVLTPAQALLDEIHSSGDLEFEFEHRGIEIDLRAEKSGEVVVIESIWSHHERGVGHGSFALKTLCDLADKHGVTLRGEVHYLIYDETLHPEKSDEALIRMGELDGQALGNESLQAWYRRFGFEIQPGDGLDDNPRIVRAPGVEPAPGRPALG